MASIIRVLDGFNHGHDRCEEANSHGVTCRRKQRPPSKVSAETVCNCYRVPLHKLLLLTAIFVAAFLILDGSSTASLDWEGAPPWYLPVGLSVALLYTARIWSVPLIIVCSVVAASVNYHRPLFSWCGIPGATGAYLGYFGAVLFVRKTRNPDLRRGTIFDVGWYLVSCLAGSVVSTGIGVLTLLGDGRIHASEVAKTAADWWASDSLAFVAFAPFVVVFVVPLARRWLKAGRGERLPWAWWGNLSSAELPEVVAQCSLVVFAIWFVFGYAPAIPYQPLYLLFIPVIWVSVRRGLPGAVLTIFAIGVGMTVAAWLTEAPRGSLPRLQLATLALGLTGLCLGAVVTDRQRGEKSLRESERRYRLLFERNMAGVFRSTTNGQILECNPAAARLFGYESADELLSSNAFSLYHSEDERNDLLARLKREKHITNQEMRLRCKNGDDVWAMLNVSLVGGDGDAPAVLEGSLMNITARKAAEERAEALAYYDPLTSLPNRTLLRDRLSQALAAARRAGNKVALLFVDLDRFKTINDSLGHSLGDLLLKEVADRLRSCSRKQDTVSRLGGDEFLIILTAVRDIPDVAVAAERFMDAMTAGYLIQGHSLTIGCSIGISVFPDHGEDTESLIKHADSAMYCAKDNGRHNFQFFTSDMNEQALERLTLENALRVALDRKELFLMYQPQMEVANGRLIGLEALLRWRHPELGLVLPDRFIRIAETSGLILPIGEWVLRTACAQTRTWQEAGLPVVPVAVNVSASQFQNDSFCDCVRTVLKDTRLEARLLELELTESLLLSNADLTIARLHELKEMGLTLTIDDFGTGYSSLSYLKRFPVSKLKIDRSFIRDVAVDADDAAITTAIINMAKSLHVKVIAEGVENVAQMSFLRVHQCEGIQGFYFSKPLTPNEVAAKLENIQPVTCTAQGSMSLSS